MGYNTGHQTEKSHQEEALTSSTQSMPIIFIRIPKKVQRIVFLNLMVILYFMWNQGILAVGAYLLIRIFPLIMSLQLILKFLDPCLQNTNLLNSFFQFGLQLKDILFMISAPISLPQSLNFLHVFFVFIGIFLGYLFSFTLLTDRVRLRVNQEHGNLWVICRHQWFLMILMALIQSFIKKPTNYQPRVSNFQDRL